MAQILDMPQLSDTMRQGVLRKWRKNEGDKMVPGEVLAEVETDKATMDFEAFDEGVLLKRLIDDGATVPVGSPIAIIGKTGEDIGNLIEEANARASGGGAKPAATAAPASRAEAAPAPKPAAPAAAPATPPPYGQSARPAPAAVRPAPTAAPRPAAPAPAPAPGSKVLASPLARKLATDLGVDLRRVQGTGPGGRIVERDVQTAGSSAGGAPAGAPPPAAEAEAPAPAPQAAAQAAAAPRPAPVQLVPERRAEARPATPPPSDDVVKPLSMMRRTIARRLLESKQSIPHYRLELDVDFGPLLKHRRALMEGAAGRVTVNDLLLRAAALALVQHPMVNAQLDGDEIVQFENADIAIAVAAEAGLVTPVLRRADQKSVAAIARESRDLIDRARRGSLLREEISGGSFTISNLGMHGVTRFDAIINAPQVAILAVGAVVQRPVVRSGALAVAEIVTLTLSADHRVVDGAVGAAFLSTLRGLLEKPTAL